VFVTHRRATVKQALRLKEQGVPACQIGSSLGVPRKTVADWLAGRVPLHPRSSPIEHCAACDGPGHSFEGLPASYAYLLGLYLGDGCIARHPRGVYRLRISLDTRYPDLVREAAHTMAVIMPASRVGRVLHGARCIEVCSYSKAWPCLLPQHGPGQKHERSIRLTEWQERIVHGVPGLLLRGLIHSDGCRFVNTGRGGWRAPRYSFVNRSAQILDLFCFACDRLGIRWTTTASPSKGTVYVSRQEDVELLDLYVGPKM